MDNAPIGIFDSGLGGLTVARAIIDQLPDEDIVYLGDTAHAPYGPRPIAEVRQLTLWGLDRLVEAVIGTQATIQSEAYVNALAAVPGLRVFQQACPLFVQYVEAGQTAGPELEGIAREYLAPLKEEGVDTLILGCTHYPLLTGVIGRVMGDNVRLVTSSATTANVTYNELVDRDLLHAPRRGAGDEPQHQFLTTDASSRFPILARRFLGPEVQSVSEVPSLPLEGDAQ